MEFFMSSLYKVLKMPLVKCPDCLNKISDRVKTCPFCGCPAEFFLSLEKDLDLLASTELVIEENKTTVENPIDNSIIDKKIISFSFGNSKVNYPKDTEKIAKLYGKYIHFADRYYNKYLDLYGSAGSIYSVLTEVTQCVIADIEQTIDEACEDLYSLGIKSTIMDFIEKYEIYFQN